MKKLLQLLLIMSVVLLVQSLGRKNSGYLENFPEVLKIVNFIVRAAIFHKWRLKAVFSFPTNFTRKTYTFLTL